MKKILLFLALFPVLAWGQQIINLDKTYIDSTWTSIEVDTLYFDRDSVYITGGGDTMKFVVDDLKILQLTDVAGKGLTTISGNIDADYVADVADANETRHFDFITTGTVDPAGTAEVNSGYFAYNKTAGSNGVYTINALEGVARSSYADEAGTFRGVYGRTYINADATSTMRTGIGGEFSARAGYSGGTECIAENGTAFVGARVWMAPYFTDISLPNINNFHGLWLHNEATAKKVTNAIYVDDMGGTGGWTNGINLAGLMNTGLKMSGTISKLADLDITETSSVANETRYFDVLTDIQTDPVAYGELSAGYFRANKTNGSNGVYTINGLEGVAGSSYADEAGTFRGVYGRTYTSAGATATMRTAIGGEFSARAGYSGGTDCVAETGTAFTGARIWMAPYFSAASLSNINNFHGLWLYNEHTSNPVTNGIYLDNVPGTGGWNYGINFSNSLIHTADILFQNGATIDNNNSNNLTITEDTIKIAGFLEGRTGRTATVIIAASNSDTLSKLQADILCDGTADEVQINTAFTMLTAIRGRIILMEGTYIINDPIIFPQNNIVLEGQGISTLINGDGLATTEHAISISGKTNCEIKNLSIQTQDGGGKISHCIFIEDGSNYTIINNVNIIDSDSDGIHIEGTNTTNITIQDCNILDTDGNGILVDMDASNTMQGMKIINNTIQSAGGIGITIKEYQYGSCNGNTVSSSTSHGVLMSTGSAYNTLNNNKIYNNGGEGIQINGSTDNTVSGNTTTGNNNCGIEFTGSAFRNVATGNTCRDNQYGIYAESSDYCSVTGNITEGNPEGGIYIDDSPSSTVIGNISRNDGNDEDGGITIEGCNFVTVTGNTSSGSTYNGIHLNGADYCTVTGNTCNENTQDGIYLSGAANYNIISNNECYNNTDDGIDINASVATENIISNNKLLNNGDAAFEDAGTGTMVMHDNIAGIWNMGVAVQISDSLILDYTASTNTLVLTPTATGRIDTLETADIATEAMTVTGLWTFDNVNIDSLQVDTLAVNTTIINEGSYKYGGAEAGGDDDYTISISGIAAYKAGMIVTFLATTDNTGACTLDVNSIAATAIKDQKGDDPVDGHIDANSFVMVGYDGTNFVLLTPDANP